MWLVVTDSHTKGFPHFKNRPLGGLAIGGHPYHSLSDARQKMHVCLHPHYPASLREKSDVAKANCQHQNESSVPQIKIQTE